MPGDPKKLRKKLGLVILKIEGKSIAVLNNQSFEEAFMKKNIDIQAEFVLLPNGKRAEVREGKIRQFLGADSEKEIEVRWDHKRKAIPEMAVRSNPGEQEVGDLEDCARAMKDYDPEEIVYQKEASDYLPQNHQKPEASSEGGELGSGKVITIGENQSEELCRNIQQEPTKPEGIEPEDPEVGKFGMEVQKSEEKDTKPYQYVDWKNPEWGSVFDEYKKKKPTAQSA
jgi:hypothetical protein